MKHLYIPAIVMASCAMMLSAQSEGAKAHTPNTSQKQSKPDYVGLDECIGAKVSMNPGAKALGSAADENEVATRPTGEIVDIVVATDTGSMEWAVVSFGGLLGIGDKTVAMPCANLQWNAATECYDADVSLDHLAALVTFDAKKARAKGLDDAMKVCATNWRSVVAPTSPDKTAKDASATKAATAKEHADRPVVAVAGTTMVANPTRLMCASEVDDYAIYARSVEFGKASNSVVDRANGKLVFVIVGHGGTLGLGKDHYLLPFAACRLATKDDATVIVVDRSATDITSGVKYEKPTEGIVDADAARRCIATIVAKPTIGSADRK